MQSDLISEALVIGATQAAVYWNDAGEQAIRWEESEGFIDCTRQATLLLGCTAEKRLLVNISLEQLQDSLKLWTRRHRLLHWLIAGMDSSLSKEIRLSGLKLAEREMSVDQDAKDFACNRLMSCPLPKDADLSGAKRLCCSLEYTFLDNWYLRGCSEIYTIVYYAEDLIEPICRILRELVYFDYDSDTPDEVYRTFVDNGVVAKAVYVAFNLGYSLDHEDPKFYPLELGDCLGNEQLQLFCPRLSDLLKDFTTKVSMLLASKSANRTNWGWSNESLDHLAYFVATQYEPGNPDYWIGYVKALLNMEQCDDEALFYAVGEMQRRFSDNLECQIVSEYAFIELSKTKSQTLHQKRIA